MPWNILQRFNDDPATEWMMNKKLLLFYFCLEATEYFFIFSRQEKMSKNRDFLLNNTIFAYTACTQKASLSRKERHMATATRAAAAATFQEKLRPLLLRAFFEMALFFLLTLIERDVWFKVKICFYVCFLLKKVFKNGLKRKWEQIWKKLPRQCVVFFKNISRADCGGGKHHGRGKW